MRPPVGFTGEFEDFCASQRIDDAVRQIGRAHIGHRRRVDRIARRPAQKIAQEHEARFARSGAERREPVRAELRRVTGLAGVARPGVVDADAGRGAKAGAERRFLLGAEQVQLGGHEPHHLALRDRQARSGQHGHDPLTGHLTLKMQRQNQTMQMRAAAAHNARRQFSRYRPPVRHRPPLAPVERHLGFERNILNDDVFVALVTRTRGADVVSVTVRSMLNFDTPGPRRRGGDASAWLGFSAAKRSVAFSMPDGFIGGRGGRPFRRRISS